MHSLISKFEIVTTALIFNDEGNVIGEVVTKPIIIYKGQKVDYDEFVDGIARIALQTFMEKRPPADK